MRTSAIVDTLRPEYQRWLKGECTEDESRALWNTLANEIARDAVRTEVRRRDFYEHIKSCVTCRKALADAGITTMTTVDFRSLSK